ncbi:MAG: Flp family type IVb pilin [Gemmatimonadota bacterium]
MLDLMTRLWREESGQDLAEYALLLALIAIVVFVAVETLGGAIFSFLWGPVTDGLQNAI